MALGFCKSWQILEHRTPPQARGRRGDALLTKFNNLIVGISLMNISFRQYHENDEESIIKLMNKLQDHLISIDPLKRMRRLPGYGENYTGQLLTKIRNNDGIIYLAEIGNNVVGCIAGVIEEQAKVDQFGYVPFKDGRVLELIVDENYRGQKIGAMLMGAMEAYFKKKDCDAVRVEVFKPNVNALQFYKKRNYTERVIDLIKQL